MLWGYFASTGPGALVKVNDIMNFAKYQDILAKSRILERFCIAEGSKIPPNVFWNLIKHLRKKLSLSSQGEGARVWKTGLPIILPLIFFKSFF